jgi:hypothetical protein
MIKCIDFVKERCDLDCGNNGHCQSGECICEEGWTGAKCSERLCDPRCLEHGQCKNGTCLCIQGWNGKHCTLGENLSNYQSIGSSLVLLCSNFFPNANHSF